MGVAFCLQLDLNHVKDVIVVEICFLILFLNGQNVVKVIIQSCFSYQRLVHLHSGQRTHPFHLGQLARTYCCSECLQNSPK